MDNGHKFNGSHPRSIAHHCVTGGYGGKAVTVCHRDHGPEVLFSETGLPSKWLKRRKSPQRKDRRIWLIFVLWSCFILYGCATIISDIIAVLGRYGNKYALTVRKSRCYYITPCWRKLYRTRKVHATIPSPAFFGQFFPF